MTFKMPPIVREAWLLDQQINERGILVDRELLVSAMAMAGRAKQELHEEVRRLTYVENPNSNAQIIAWLRMHKYPFPSLEKSWVARALADGVPEEVKRVLVLRSEAARTSDSKLEAILNRVSSDGRLRQLFNYMGASRTGRWTSGSPQFQNLAKPLFEDKDGSRLKLARELIRAGNYEAVHKEFGSVVDAVVSIIQIGRAHV